MKQKFERKLISKEIELGFLYIPSEARRGFPKENDRIKVLLGKGKQPVLLSYNSKYNRLFGLTAWYGSHSTKPKDTPLSWSL